MPKRDLIRKIDIRPQGLTVFGGSAGGGMRAHDIIGSLHYVDGRAGLVVGVNPDDTLTLLDIQDLVDLWGGLFVGRLEGAHAGLFLYDQDGQETYVLQVTDSGGTPFLSAGGILDEPNTTWLKLGYEGYDQLTMTPPVADSSNPEEHRGVQLPASAVYITDSGDYFASSSLENVLQEIGARLTALEGV